MMVQHDEVFILGPGVLVTCAAVVTATTTLCIFDHKTYCSEFSFLLRLCQAETVRSKPTARKVSILKSMRWAMAAYRVL